MKIIKAFRTSSWTDVTWFWDSLKLSFKEVLGRKKNIKESTVTKANAIIR